MQEIILKQRALVDLVIKNIREIREINQGLTASDPSFVTDLLCIIGQHRHTFEEQSVTDHKECLSSLLISGSYEGVCGLLLMLGSEFPLARKAIKEAASRL